MAFDLQFKKRIKTIREKITHDEEYFFRLIEDDANYPVLNWVWEEFYNGPKISIDKVDQLIHELIALKTDFSKHKHAKQINYFSDRLVIFFNEAYRIKQQVICISD